MNVLLLLLTLASANTRMTCASDEISAPTGNAFQPWECKKCPQGQTPDYTETNDGWASRCKPGQAEDPLMKKAAALLEAGDREGACAAARQASANKPGDANAAGMAKLACDKRQGNFQLDTSKMKRHDIDPSKHRDQAAGGNDLTQRKAQSQMGNFQQPTGSQAQPGGFDPQSGQKIGGREFDEAKVAIPTVALGSIQPVATSYDKTMSAQDKINQGNYADAAVYAEEAISLDPKNVRAHVLMTAALEADDRHEEALKAANAALTLAPQNVTLLKAKAKASAKLKDFDGAVAAAESALAVNATDAMALVLKAYALGKKGDTDAMLNALKTAAALDPSYERMLLEAQNGSPVPDEPFVLPGDGKPRQQQGVRRVKKEDPNRNLKVMLFLGGVFALFIIGGMLLYSLVQYRAAQQAAQQASPEQEAANTPGS